MQVLKIVRWCCIIQLKRDILGRKSKGHLSMVFISVQINKFWIYTLQNCYIWSEGWRRRSPHGLWLFQLRSASEKVFKSQMNLSWKRGKDWPQKHIFKFRNDLKDLWTDLMRSPMPLPKPIILSFGHLFVMILQPTWLGCNNHFYNQSVRTHYLGGLCTAIVTQLPFVSMELLSNKFEVQWYSYKN